MSNKQVSPPRVRFAPSPTGHLHLGGLRTALFNWLFARHHGGSFLLRIEDTDLERSQEKYTQSILEAFKWASLDYDEPLIIQSERVEEHKQYAQKMLENGTAYKCYCSSEELERRLGSNYVTYDQRCRDLQPSDTNAPYVIRFKRPLDRTGVTFNDLIRGPITIEMDQIDDFIIVRSDGSPMYNFVVVIDDAFMRISHVIRGEDHISNTPKQILLYEALGFSVPQFAHVSMILGPDGNRLSKRDAATAVLDYRDKGFLPDALCNYLVRLGWSHGDQEIFTRQELINYFSLDEIGKKGAIFDIKKLEWINGVYIRHSTPHTLLSEMQAIDPLFTTKINSWPQEQTLHTIRLYQDRVKTLRELMSELETLYQPPVYELQAASDFNRVPTANYLDQIVNKLDSLEEFTAPAIELAVKEVCVNNSIKLSIIAPAIRMGLTGKTASAGIYELIALLGKSETVQRLRQFQKVITHS
jgi:glutamyl-tRNA synthetase